MISTGHLDGQLPAWLISEFTSVKSHGQLYVGANIADPLPARTPASGRRSRTASRPLANAAKAAGADGMAMDAEPYGSRR